MPVSIGWIASVLTTQWLKPKSNANGGVLAIESAIQMKLPMEQNSGGTFFSHQNCWDLSMGRDVHFTHAYGPKRSKHCIWCVVIHPIFGIHAYQNGLMTTYSPNRLHKNRNLGSSCCSFGSAPLWSSHPNSRCPGQLRPAVASERPKTAPGAPGKLTQLTKQVQKLTHQQYKLGFSQTNWGVLPQLASHTSLVFWKCWDRWDPRNAWIMLGSSPWNHWTRWWHTLWQPVNGKTPCNMCIYYLYMYIYIYIYTFKIVYKSK